MLAFDTTGSGEGDAAAPPPEIKELLDPKQRCGALGRPGARAAAVAA